MNEVATIWTYICNNWWLCPGSLVLVGLAFISFTRSPRKFENLP